MYEEYIINSIIRKNADIDHKDKKKLNSKYYAIHNKNYNIMKTLGVKDAFTYLIDLIKKYDENDKILIKHLFKEIDDVNQVDNNGKTILIWLAYKYNEPDDFDYIRNFL